MATEKSVGEQYTELLEEIRVMPKHRRVMEARTAFCDFLEDSADINNASFKKAVKRTLAEGVDNWPPFLQDLLAIARPTHQDGSPQKVTYDTVKKWRRDTRAFGCKMPGDGYLTAGEIVYLANTYNIPDIPRTVVGVEAMAKRKGCLSRPIG